MRRFLLSLSFVAVSAMAFAAPKTATWNADCQLPFKAATFGKEKAGMFNRSFGQKNQILPGIEALSTPAKAPEATVNVKVKALQADNYMFEGWVLFLNENYAKVHYFPEDEETWEYATEGTFELPAGTYDVIMRYQREQPIATASMIFKEQLVLTDGMEIEFDPTVATYKLKGALTTQDGKLISPGLEGPGGSVVEEQTLLYFENEVGLLPTFGKFILSGVGAMCFEMMFPEEWADYSTLYVNEVSDRYIVYANAFGSDYVENGYIAVAHKAGGVHGDMVITNEGQEYASYEPKFADNVYADESPVGEKWRMLPFVTFYWNDWGWSRNSLGGYYDKLWLSTPAPDFNFVAYGYCPEGSDALAYVDWGYGPEPERVAMMGQPMFNKDGRMFTLDTQMFSEDLTFTGRDGSSSGEYYLDSPFNYYNDKCELMLGNTVPVVSIMNFQYDFGDEIVNGYAITDYGRMGENRTDVDQCDSSVELYIDGEVVVSPKESLTEWMWSTNCVDYKNSAFRLSVVNNNTLIDNSIQGLVIANAYADWSTGDRQAPMLNRLLTIDTSKDVLTDRFSKAEDGLLMLAAADFPFQIDPETEYLWVHSEPVSVKVRYAPHNTSDWADLSVTADNAYDIPTYGNVYKVSTAAVDRKSADGWFDVFITLTDAAGNFLDEVLRPCFYIDDLNGIDNVKGHSSTVVTGVKNAIVVAGTTGARIEVFSTSGAKVADTTASRIPVPTGIYVVRVDGETFKVAVR